MTWRMAFAFSRMAVTETLVAGAGVMVGLRVTVCLRLNDWDDIMKVNAHVSV